MSNRKIVSARSTEEPSREGERDQIPEMRVIGNDRNVLRTFWMQRENRRRIHGSDSDSGNESG